MEFLFKITTSNVTDLEIEEPIGWADSILSIKRDTKKYHGLFFGYTTSLEFINDGFQEARKEFNLRGFDGYMLVKIYLACESSFIEVYRGEADFSSYSDVRNSGCSATMDITESTLQILTVNRQDIMTDMEATTSLDGYDISGNTLFDLTMHNYTLSYQGRWSNIEDEVKIDSTFNEAATGVPYYNYFRSPLCIELDEIGGMRDCVADLVSNIVDNSMVPDWVRDQRIFTAQRPSTYTFTFKLKGFFQDVGLGNSRAAALNIRFEKNQPSSFAPVTLYNIYSGAIYTRAGNADAFYPFDVEDTFTAFLNAGEIVCLDAFVTNHVLTTGSGLQPVRLILSIEHGSFYQVNEASTFPETVAKSAKIYDAFWKTIANYTGSKDAFYSQLLGYPDAPDRAYVSSGCASYIALTNGYNVRGFPSKPIFASLTDLFDSIDAIYNIGLGFEVQRDNVLRVRMEGKEFFYSNGTLLAFWDDVAEIKTSVIKELAYNTFKLGFENYKVEEGTEKLNTNDEFLTQFTWATTTRAIKNSFEKLSKYISSLYIIEYTRRNRYLSNATKESKYDEKNFLIAMNRSGANKAEKDERFDSVAGVTYGNEAYNLRFNLFSTLLRWSNIFGGSVSRLIDKTIKFTFGSLNNDLTLEYKNEEVCEGNYKKELFVTNQDLGFNDPNNDVGKPIYEPISYEFEYPLSFDEFNRFKRFPNGTIIFGRNLESLIQAFILDVEYRPTEGIANFKLLRSYEQNIGLFFPNMPSFEDLKKMGVIVDYYGTISIFDTTGRGTGTYEGFALCNGQNGTPDLRGKFIVSYDPDNSDYSTIGNAGGDISAIIGINNMPPHNHGGGDHNHTYGAESGGAGQPEYDVNSGSGSNGRPTSSSGVIIQTQGGGDPIPTRPPYFVLAKIMYL